MYFITGNKGKFEEASAILGDSVKLKQLDIDLTEIQSLDSHEIIGHKLQEALKHRRGQFVVEDVSVDIKCLKGFPGPLIKWFWKSLGNKGIADLVNKYDNQTVIARAIVGYSRNKRDIHFFESNVKGKIVQPRGANGFGWDPIFEVEGLGKTLAELTSEEKNKISMRKKSFGKLKKHLKKKF